MKSIKEEARERLRSFLRFWVVAGFTFYIIALLVSQELSPLYSYFRAHTPVIKVAFWYSMSAAFVALSYHSQLQHRAFGGEGGLLRFARFPIFFLFAYASAVLGLKCRPDEWPFVYIDTVAFFGILLFIIFVSMFRLVFISSLVRKETGDERSG